VGVGIRHFHHDEVRDTVDITRAPDTVRSWDVEQEDRVLEPDMRPCQGSVVGDASPFRVLSEPERGDEEVTGALNVLVAEQYCGHADEPSIMPKA